MVEEDVIEKLKRETAEEIAVLYKVIADLDLRMTKAEHRIIELQAQTGH